MAILEKTVSIALHPRNMEHFIRLGYEMPKIINKYGKYTVPKGTKVEVLVEHLMESSKARLTKICDICYKHSKKLLTYNSILRNRGEDGKDYCNTCKYLKVKDTWENKEIPVGKSLAERYPELVEQWHPTKNLKTPTHVYGGSRSIFWWKCMINSRHEYESTISHRIEGKGCPYCSGQKACEDNCLATTHSHLLDEWDFDKNIELSPYNVTAGSNKYAWWKCGNGHGWNTQINNKTSKESKCPYCTNKKACIDNCLITTHPLIAEEWDYENNNTLTPYDLTYGSEIRINWKCKVCSHKWEASIKDRTSKESGCPECFSSKGEKIISKYLTNRNIRFRPQYKFRGLVGVGGNSLKFDFAIINKNKSVILLIEYDGEFHYEKIHEGDGFKNTKIHDQLKDEYCLKHNISLLRIPYWDFDNIESILDEKLNNIL